MREPTGELSARTISDQKRIIQRLASGTARRIERVIIDDGAETSEGVSVVLQATIEEARTSSRCVTLVIAGTACLGMKLEARHAALAALLTAGLIVEDPSGSLIPTLATVALAKAAAERGARRKLLKERDVDV